MPTIIMFSSKSIQHGQHIIEVATRRIHVGSGSVSFRAKSSLSSTISSSTISGFKVLQQQQPQRQQQQQQRRLVTSNTGLPDTNHRYFSSTQFILQNPNPLDAFRDSIDRQTRMNEPVGRSWSVKELRRKSYTDLHKLWYILYKEKNMLLTEQQLSRRRQLQFPQQNRLRKVQKSMGAIKHVLGERKLVKVKQHLLSQQEKMEAAMIEESLQGSEDDIADDGDEKMLVVEEEKDETKKK